eukprot:4844456-Amphidinium_carterae.1
MEDALRTDGAAAAGCSPWLGMLAVLPASQHCRLIVGKEQTTPPFVPKVHNTHGPLMIYPESLKL